jgi:hypothetical protein
MSDPAARSRHARRLRSQLLSGPKAHTPVEVVSHLLSVQAQDLPGARLAVRARSTGLSAASVDEAFNDRRLVVSWLQRGTLHLVAAEDFWWLHDLLAPRQASATARRLSQEGVSPTDATRAVHLLTDAVAAGPRTRAKLRELLASNQVPTAGQAFVHLLAHASRLGLLVRGPVVDGEQAFVSPASWLGPRPEPLDEDVAVRRLVERYLVGHAPADPRDLARWSSLPLRPLTRAFEQIASPRRPGPPPALPPPRLLGPFDPVLLGWDGRGDIVGQHVGVVTSNGLFRPVALVAGRAVATWRIRGDRVASLDWLEPVDAAARAALEVDAADVNRFLTAGHPSRATVRTRR